jgi:hypothetical protein
MDGFGFGILNCNACSMYDLNAMHEFFTTSSSSEASSKWCDPGFLSFILNSSDTLNIKCYDVVLCRECRSTVALVLMHICERDCKMHRLSDSHRSWKPVNDCYRA